MKLIIELDDDIAKGIRGENDCEVEPREIARSFQATIADAIKNGTPYNPTGDLISREAVRSKIWKERVDKDEGCNSEYIRGLKTAIGFINNAQAVDRPQGDCISRKQVLEELMAHQYSQDFCKEHGIEYSINSSMVRIIVNSAQAVYEENKPKENDNG